MRPVLEIERARIAENIRAVRRRIAPAELMMVMKDDAYGFGVDLAVGVAAAESVDWFGSFDIPNALRIRDLLGPEHPTAVFAWTTSPDDEIAAAIAARVDIGVGTVDYLERIVMQARLLGRPALVHPKIDTGLHRNGVRPEQWPVFADRLAAAERAGEVRVVGVWSHLAEASDDEDDAAQAVFVAAAERLEAVVGHPLRRHLTASAASWDRPELRGDLCRIGAFCYGIRPADAPVPDGIRPAATLSATVLSADAAGARIGIGSFDGLPSTLAGMSVVTPGGMRAVRRIESSTSEVDGWSGAAAGQRVVLFGPGRAGEADPTSLAERIGTVGEEILTRLTDRVVRVVVD